MLINAKFEGLVERVISAMLRKGIATTKAEAIRHAVIDYSKNNPSLVIMPEADEIRKMGYGEWKKGFESLTLEMASMKDEEVGKSILEAQKKRHQKWLNVH